MFRMLRNVRAPKSYLKSLSHLRCFLNNGVLGVIFGGWAAERSVVLSVDPSQTTDNLRNQKLSCGWGKTCTTLSPPFFVLQKCYIARGIRKISSIRNAALKKPGPKTSQRQHEATPYMGIPCRAKYKCCDLI